MVAGRMFCKKDSEEGDYEVINESLNGEPTDAFRKPKLAGAGTRRPPARTFRQPLTHAPSRLIL